MKPLGAEIEVYDATLRDGTQREGISLSAVDKIQIARLLDRMGVAFIELGYLLSFKARIETYETARS